MRWHASGRWLWFICMCSLCFCDCRFDRWIRDGWSMRVAAACLPFRWWLFAFCVLRVACTTETDVTAGGWAKTHSGAAGSGSNADMTSPHNLILSVSNIGKRLSSLRRPTCDRWPVLRLAISCMLCISLLVSSFTHLILSATILDFQQTQIYPQWNSLLSSHLYSLLGLRPSLQVLEMLVLLVSLNKRKSWYNIHIIFRM